MASIRLAALLAGLMMLASLAGCRWPHASEAPKPVAERITWCGRHAALVLDSAPADTSAPGASVRIQRLEFPGARAPFRVELRRYRSAFWAFAAWEGLGARIRPQDGCIRLGPRWAFIHGPYLGLTDTGAAELYPEEFRTRLAFDGETAFLLPPEFAAFPLLGRIPGSERVVLRDFLGAPWRGPVFSVAYPCHGDTALAFRASSREADSLLAWIPSWKARTDSAFSGKRKRFAGLDAFGRPLLLRLFPEGIWGVSGCFDSQLAEEYAEKMRKMQVFWHDP
jgi:hypothetical protein